MSVNVTSWENDENFLFVFDFLLPGVLLTFVGVLGLVGNVISMVVLGRPQMKSSINFILIGLASCDIFLILTSILMFGLRSLETHTRWSYLTYYVCNWMPRLMPKFLYPFGMIAQTGSAYLTLAVTVERYVAVCQPLKARYLCTYGRAKIYVAVIVLFAALYNVPRFFEVTYGTFFDQGTNETCDYPLPSELRSNGAYINVYINTMYLVFMYVVPFTSLAVFNLLIYREVKRANKERARLTRLQQKEIGLATMLMVVVLVFFLCNFLALVINVLEVYKKNFFWLNNVSNLLVTINSSVNFIIYCIFGDKFKRIFFRLFCPTIVALKAGIHRGTDAELPLRFQAGGNGNAAGYEMSNGGNQSSSAGGGGPGGAGGGGGASSSASRSSKSYSNSLAASCGRIHQSEVGIATSAKLNNGLGGGRHFHHHHHPHPHLNGNSRSNSASSFFLSQPKPSLFSRRASNRRRNLHHQLRQLQQKALAKKPSTSAMKSATKQIGQANKLLSASASVPLSSSMASNVVVVVQPEIHRVSKEEAKINNDDADVNDNNGVKANNTCDNKMLPFSQLKRDGGKRETILTTADIVVNGGGLCSNSTDEEKESLLLNSRSFSHKII